MDLSDHEIVSVIGRIPLKAGPLERALTVGGLSSRAMNDLQVKLQTWSIPYGPLFVLQWMTSGP